MLKIAAINRRWSSETSCMGQFCREDMNNFMAERLWFIHASLSKGLSSRANKPNFGRHGVWRNLKTFVNCFILFYSQLKSSSFGRWHRQSALTAAPYLSPYFYVLISTRIDGNVISWQQYSFLIKWCFTPASHFSQFSCNFHERVSCVERGQGNDS